MPYAISNPEFGFEQDFKVIQYIKFKLGQIGLVSFLFNKMTLK